jgi:hypothetical protein
MNVDDEGDMTFTVNITYQTKDPIADPQTHADITDILIQRAGQSFQGMRLTKRTGLSRDQRIMTIRLVYKEIKSDNAFHPFTHDCSVSDDVESDLFGRSVLQGKGFYTWRRTLSGTITLPARVHKAWTWVVFLKIIRSRFKKLYPFQKISPLFDVTKPAAQPENDPSVTEQFYYLPLRLKFKNDLYTRKMRFECVYVLVCDLENLWNSTKMFARVNTLWTGDEHESEPEPLSTQWKHWQDRKNVNLNGIFEYTLDGVPIVYSQCNGTYTDHQFGSETTLPYEDDPDWDTGEGSGGGGSEETDAESQAYDGAYPESKYGDGLESKYSWIRYDNDFQIIEDTNNIPVSYLEEPPATFYLTQDASNQMSTTHRDYDGMSVHGKPNVPYTQTHPTEVIDTRNSTAVRTYT